MEFFLPHLLFTFLSRPTFLQLISISMRGKEEIIKESKIVFNDVDDDGIAEIVTTITVRLRT